MTCDADRVYCYPGNRQNQVPLTQPHKESSDEEKVNDSILADDILYNHTITITCDQAGAGKIECAYPT